MQRGRATDVPVVPHVANTFALLVVAVSVEAGLLALDAALRVHQIRLESEAFSNSNSHTSSDQSKKNK